MPREQVAQLGVGPALMHLSSDAVRAAATSPFLEASAQVHGLPVAILCSLSLPVRPFSVNSCQMESSSSLMHLSRDTEHAAATLSFLEASAHRLPVAILCSSACRCVLQAALVRCQLKVEKAGQAVPRLSSDTVRPAAPSPSLEVSAQVHGLPVAMQVAVAPHE